MKWILAWLALVSCAHAATSELAGTTAAGSAYRIAVPEGWKPGDGLVLVQHGYRFTKVLQPTLGPSAQAMLADGYAIAAPGYREAGWALPEAVQDNADVLAEFRARVGEPGRVIAHGGSMGALIALKLAEDDELKPHIDGVLALCPAADGVGLWDRVFDLRIAYDALCASVPGGALPAGAPPTSWASNLDIQSGAPSDPLALPATMRAHPAVQACLALHLPAGQRSAAQAARIAGLRELMATDEETLAALLAYAYFGLSDLVRGPDKLAGVHPFHNQLGEDNPFWMRYRRGNSVLPENFNSQVQRVVQDDFARLAFNEDVSLKGIVDVPVVAVSTSLDGVLPPGQLGFLRARLGERTTTGVVRETVPTHCGFTQPEYDAVWDVARDAAEGEAVMAADFTQACAARGDAAACRFDANAVHEPSPSGLRFPLSEITSHSSIDSFGGLWWDPARPAQGFMIEELDDTVGSWGAGEQRVAMTWYTWAPQSDPNPGPRWYHGIGRAWGKQIAVDLLEVRGGRFGVLLDPAAISYEPWGRVEISFATKPATLHYAGPPAFGSGSMAMEKLIKAGTGLGGGLAFSPPLDFDFERTGTYYDRAHPAGGWVLNQYDGDDGVVDSLLLWFTWDANGRPLWMYAIDGDARDGLFFRMLWAMSGGRFEPGYPLSQVQFREWGDVGLQSESCPEGRVTQVDWRADTHGFGDGHVPVARLTRPTMLHVVPRCRP